jgi:GrpB-like predicted nucleotidyltransferase (UPF0157 family)
MSQFQATFTAALVPGRAHPPVEITLVPYTPEWARDFQRERQRLIDAWNQLGTKNFVPDFRHIGSTSIPGAIAKPYIDISMSDNQHNDHFTAVPAFFEMLGYCQYGCIQSISGTMMCSCDSYYKADTRYWYKPSLGESSNCKGYFLHRSSSTHDNFRECLQSDPSLVQRYNEAKRRILADHPIINFADYTMLKTAFVMSVSQQKYSSKDAEWNAKPSLYELIHFISATAAGLAPSTLHLPFTPNEIFKLGYVGMYNIGFHQQFTPLGLALILAIDPRLSALSDVFCPGDDPGHGEGVFGRLPSDAVPSEVERQQRLARFQPVIRRLMQHGCTDARFFTSTCWDSPLLDAAKACAADSSGIASVDLDIRDINYQFYESVDWLTCPNLRAPESYIFLPDLRNFGPSAAALCGVAGIARALNSLQLSQLLVSFIKEKVSDDVACSLSTEDLRALGLSVGDARRFSVAVQQEMAALQSKIKGSAAESGGSTVGDIGSALPSPSLSLSTTPPPPAAVVARSLASSNFKRAYEAADCPELQHELFSSMHSFLAIFCHLYGAPASAAKSLFQRLQGEAFENPQELLSEIQVAASRIWTSTQKLQGTCLDKTLNAEFCSLLNRALRDDIAELMPHVAVIVRAINALCIVRRDAKTLKFPPNSVSHRGGALPTEHQDFFTVGKKYRVPMYLATSFSEDKANEFWCAAPPRPCSRYSPAHRLTPRSGTALSPQNKCLCTGSSTSTRAPSTCSASAART